MKNNMKLIKIPEHTRLVTSCDLDGRIKKANAAFCQINGYNEREFVGASYRLIRHPEMPSIIFKKMWTDLKDKKEVNAIILNKTRDGNSYWVKSKIIPYLHPNNQSTYSYTGYQQPIKRKIINQIKPLYEKLLEEERRGGIEASEVYLKKFLIKKRMPYEQFIAKVLNEEGFLHALKHFTFS